ncbi:hypothetical protein [Ilumatobacter sp.]|uniref:hypothetical protein n=1 Tax=Ilumatobacter sp. TaxID=1967498 RepID=UPI0037539E72
MSENPNHFDKELTKRQIEQAEKIPWGLLRCRIGGDRHHWHRVQPDWQPSNKAIPVAMQCRRCLTVKRMDVEGTYGTIIGRPSYQYPDNYRIKDGPDDPGISSRAVRVVMARPPSGHVVPKMKTQ